MRRRSMTQKEHLPDPVPTEEPETSKNENLDEPDKAEARSPKSPYFLRSTARAYSFESLPSASLRGTPVPSASLRGTRVRSSSVGGKPARSSSVGGKPARSPSGGGTPARSPSGGGTPVRTLPSVAEGSREGTPLLPVSGRTRAGTLFKESESSVAPVLERRGSCQELPAEMHEGDAEIPGFPEVNQEIEARPMALREALSELGEAVPEATSPQPGAGGRNITYLIVPLGSVALALVFVVCLITEHFRVAYWLVGVLFLGGICGCCAHQRSLRRVGPYREDEFALS